MVRYESVEEGAYKVFNYGSEDALISLADHATNVSLDSPYRAQYGTPKQFPIIVSQALLVNYFMQFDMPTTNLIVDHLDTFESTAAPSNKSVAIPWLPFFSQCRGYGRHIYLYELTELSDNCSLVPPSEVLMGFESIGDRCRVVVSCTYEENFTTNYVGQAWWQSRGDTLFYIGANPVDTEEFIRIMSTPKMEQLVPVKFHSVDAFPSEWHFDIQYKQVNAFTKQVVRADVRAISYSTGTDSSYTLVFTYTPMGYYDLINEFEFGTPVYILIFTIVGLLCIAFAFALWLLNTTLVGVRNPLRFRQTLRLAFVPPLVGTALATVPTLVLLVVLSSIASHGLFDGVHFMWDPASVHGGTVAMYNQGRIGLIVLITGLILIKIGTSLILREITPEQFHQIQIDDQKLKTQQGETMNIVESVKKKRGGVILAKIDSAILQQKEEPTFKSMQTIQDAAPHEPNQYKRNISLTHNTFFSMPDEEIDAVDADDINTEEEEEDTNEETQLHQMLYKNYHYQSVALLTSFFLLYLLGISYMDVFRANIFYFVMVIQFVDITFAYFLSHYFLRESLLVQPILACMEVFYFTIFLAAGSIMDFLYIYIVRMGITTLFSIYVVNWEHYAAVIPDSIIQFYLNRPSEFRSASSTENVIANVLSYSAKVHATFLKPFLLLVLYLFGWQYGIAEFYYYILFAFMIIVPQIVVDIYFLNSLEVVYGYKLYDYFHYCRYRYDIRQYEQFKLDLSIAPQHRSIDMGKFTEQFYFNGSVLIYGVIATVVGVTIIIQNSYRAYEDPIISVQILFVSALIYVCKYVLTYVWMKFDPWQIRPYKPKPHLDGLDEYLNPVKENLHAIMGVDLIRRSFVQVNKDWVIANLGLFLTGDAFLENDEYLLKLYDKLLNEIKRDEIEAKRLALLQKKNPHTDRSIAKVNETLATKHSMHDDLRSEDFNAPENQNTIIRITNKQNENLRKILQLWYYKARQNLYLKSLVSHIVDRMLEDHCKRCGIDIELRVVEYTKLEKMSNMFKYRSLGVPFNKVEWRRFYEKHQKFITLCLDCEISFIARMHERKNPTTPKAAQKQDGEATVVARQIVLCWLMVARSNILYSLE